ncbi:MAG: DinB family protein [Planctomycetota bacterium]
MSSELQAPATTAPHAEQRDGLIAAQNVVVLEQGLAVFGRLDAELYTGVPEGLTPSAVGGHFRHIHDYYRCFLRDVESGRIDYDRRERDPRFETDLEHATSEYRATLAALTALRDGDAELLVKMDAVDGGPIDWSRSTVARELRFLISHTIHHYALIAMILKVQGFDCGPGFGVAPSTLEYWESRAACAPSPGSEA